MVSVPPGGEDDEVAFREYPDVAKHHITNATSESIDSKVHWVKYTALDLRNIDNLSLRSTSTAEAWTSARGFPQQPTESLNTPRRKAVASVRHMPRFTIEGTLTWKYSPQTDKPMSPTSCVLLAVLASVRVAMLPMQASAQSTDAEILSNNSVVSMMGAKVSKELILTKIRSTKAAFDVSTAGLIALHQSKVPQDVVKAMMLAATDAKLAVPRSGPAEVLTNSDIIQLVGSKVPRPLILEKIRISKARYDVTSAGLVNLSASKVPQDVVKAMMAVPPAPPPSSSAGPNQNHSRSKEAGAPERRYRQRAGLTTSLPAIVTTSVLAPFEDDPLETPVRPSP